jgi:hypothetical protein
MCNQVGFTHFNKNIEMTFISLGESRYVISCYNSLVTQAQML